MTTRNADITAFLTQHGWDSAERHTLAGDASFRRYHRLHRSTNSSSNRAMLMDAPPPENIRPFIAVAELLHQQQLSAPAIFGRDETSGLLLLEDFGDDTYTRLLNQGVAAEPLYALAVDTLIALHHAKISSDAVPLYDDTRLSNEVALLTDWYLPAITGNPTPSDVRSEWLNLWSPLFAVARQVPSNLVLRDYHVDNLMRLDGRKGVAACGLLDFQDAVWGPVAYDLVSLLEDARRDVPPALAAAMTARYLAAFPDIDPDKFAAAYAVLGAQRNAKIVGIFTRLSRRDNKHGYLPHIARTWRLLEGDLAHPALSSIRDFLDHHIPKARRTIPAAPILS